MASNHGAEEFTPEFKRLLDETPGFGATGRFPEGKLTPDDEGELQFGITNANGQVIINFGKPVAWLGMTAHQARAFAEGILQNANEARMIGGNRAERRAAAAKHRSEAKVEG